MFNRYTDMVYDAFADMVESQNYFALTRVIEEWSRKIFAVQQVKFYLVEESQLIYYRANPHQ